MATCDSAVRVYGASATATLLRLVAALSPWLGLRLSCWLANRLLHALLWARVGRQWLPLGRQINITVGEVPR